MKPSINITDVEKLIALFDDSKYQNIEKLLCEFEDLISLFNLSDLHKLILRKRCMAGKFKLLIKSESKLNSCSKLKSLVIYEFDLMCNSAELHKLLSKRKIRDNESLHEYLLNMKQLYSRDNVEDSALI